MNGRLPIRRWPSRDAARHDGGAKVRKAGKTYTTLELKVNYVRTLTDKVPLVRAIGEIVHSGGRIGTSQGHLLGPDGKLYAHGTTTCIVLDAR